MLDKIERTFKDLISALQICRLYPDWHPEFKKGVDKAYSSLQEILSSKDELVIGIVGEELAYDKEIFFDLSKTAKPIIVYLKDRGIEKIKFSTGLNKDELSKFISFLITPKEQIKYEPQEYLEFLGIKNIVVGKIKVSPYSGLGLYPGDKMTNFLNIYYRSSDKLSGMVDKILNEEEIDYLVLRGTVSNVMENLIGHYHDLLNLAKIKRFDLKTFYHILNVSILSMFFSSRLGFSKDETLNIGVAALLHDIGKLYISRKIIQKPGRLTDEEFTKIKSHVTLGTSILLRYIERLGILPVVVCFEHHLKYNLKGYPKVLFYKELHIASMIVSICDVYDALYQRRTYKMDYPPNMIYDIMTREKGDAFDSVLLDKFFKLIGVWPVGTIVLLSDGSIAVVREENEDDIFSPKVELIHPQDKRASIDLRKTKERNKIERSLNPLGEGKEYLALVYQGIPDTEK